MIYWAKRRCDPGGEIPLMKLVGDLQLKLGAPHELMMLGSPPLTRKHFDVFIGVPQRELLDLFDGFTEIQENKLPEIRRECTDHLIVFNAEHLRRILAKYATYYNEMRTHVSLGKDAPCTRPVERFGDVISQPILGGLHHRYART